MIVAQILPSCAGDLSKATADAVHVWETSAAEIAKWQPRIDADRAASAEHEALRIDAASTDSKPLMPFAQILKILMPGMKDEDKTANFRHYLSHATGLSLIEAGELLGNYGERLFTPFQFNGIRDAFKIWNRERLSKIRSDSGRKGGRPKNNSKIPLVESSER